MKRKRNKQEHSGKLTSGKNLEALFLWFLVTSSTQNRLLCDLSLLSSRTPHLTSYPLKKRNSCWKYLLTSILSFSKNPTKSSTPSLSPQLPKPPFLIKSTNLCRILSHLSLPDFPLQKYLLSNFLKRNPTLCPCRSLLASIRISFSLIRSPNDLQCQKNSFPRVILLFAPWFHYLMP